MAEQLQVEIRQTRGKYNTRRMRKRGSTPAVLYGHGQETISLVVPADALEAAIRHGSRVVELAGAVNESALIRELQWDTWGSQVLHVDFARVSAHEIIEVTISLKFRGEAPGVKDGGVIEHIAHEVRIRCKATAVPEGIDVNINRLELNQSITVADLDPPKGVEFLAEPETVIVHCVEPVEVVEEEAVKTTEAEPDVISRKDEEEDKEAEKK